MDYLSAVLGQDKTVNNLRKAMKKGSISHAYLFIGPEGVGKMFTAKMWAYSLICESDRDAHIYLKEGIHPDLLIIEKEENKTVITKDSIVRDLEPWLALKPYRSKYRIAIIRDAHLLSIEAANALLKTLEEPPFYAVIVLVADENSLLQTIVSRCQLVRFSPLSNKIVKDFLMDQKVSEEKAAEIAELAQGSLTYALKFAKEDLFEHWQAVLSIITGLSLEGEAYVFEAAEKMEADPYLIVRMLQMIIRDILIYDSTGKEELLVSKNSIDVFKLLKGVNREGLRKAIDKINELKSYYWRNVNSLIININICYAIKNALD
ncbi:hypothetical protein [Thermosyntropha sp.]|uniref:DNA polymerase III subunit n=1 Tax=Thermosyntropha sp. TaxID=2740820 RepID=UPI0025E77F46|nr:hypothetical protein [Thermosyntropha sp.]MBO8159961.1 hypothetical protein [Thermosyntropha sp.]